MEIDKLEELSDDELKALLKEKKAEVSRHKIMQTGLKVTLNSAYGMIGNEYSRYYDLRIAEGITVSGQLSIRWIERKVNEYLNKILKTENENFVVAGDSVSGDSCVIVDGSYVPIESLFIDVNHTIGDKEYHIPNNLMVLSYDEKTHRTCYKRVVSVMRHKADKRMYRTSITNQQSILTTEDHSLIGYVNTQKRRAGGSIFVEVKPTEIYGTVVYLKHIPRNSNTIRSLNLPTYIYEFMGLVLADGCREVRSVCVSIGNDDIAELTWLFDALISGGYATSYKIRKNGHNVRIYGKNICDIIDTLYSDGVKGVPQFIRNETDDNIRAFLRGWFTGDGTVYNNASLCNINRYLIEDAKTLLFYVGVSSTVFMENTENSYNGVCSRTYSYKLSVKGDFSEIGFLLERKQAKLPANTKRMNYFEKMGYDFQLSNVCDVVEVYNFDDYVYDLEVEDTHVFFANDILVHNTDSIYFTLKPLVDKVAKGKSPETIVKFLDRVCSEKFEPFIDDAYVELATYMNAFAQKMFMKREVIADRGIWRAKKNYILNVHNSEGVQYEEPKLKIMGIESTRSSTPEICRDAIKSTLKVVMVGDEHVAQEHIKKFREEFMDKPVEDISFPRGVSDVDKWYVQDNERFKSGTPIHVKAALTYNRLIRKYGLEKQYRLIQNGDKLKFVYLVKNNPTHNNAIAFPDVLPPEFQLDNFLDKVLQYQKSFLEPMRSIFTVIGWSTEKVNSIYDFFD